MKHTILIHSDLSVFAFYDYTLKGYVTAPSLNEAALALKCVFRQDYCDRLHLTVTGGLPTELPDTAICYHTPHGGVIINDLEQCQ
jgi:hypothetical protein